MKRKDARIKAQDVKYDMQRLRSSLKALTALSCMFSLFTPFYLSAEALSDIKIDALQKEIKPVIKEKWGRDPFVKYEDRISAERLQKEDLLLDIKLDGIISDGKKAMAIINGGFYRKGDRVNDFLIVGIEKDAVLLKKNGEMLPPLSINKFVVDGKPKKGGGK